MNGTYSQSKYRKIEELARKISAITFTPDWAVMPTGAELLAQEALVPRDDLGYPMVNTEGVIR